MSPLDQRLFEVLKKEFPVEDEGRLWKLVCFILMIFIEAREGRPFQ